MKPRVVILDFAIHSTVIFSDKKGKKHTRCVIDDADFVTAKSNPACSWADDVATIPTDMTNKHGNAIVTFMGEPFGQVAPKDIEKEIVSG